MSSGITIPKLLAAVLCGAVGTLAQQQAPVSTVRVYMPEGAPAGAPLSAALLSNNPARGEIALLMFCGPVTAAFCGLVDVATYRASPAGMDATGSFTGFSTASGVPVTVVRTITASCPAPVQGRATCLNTLRETRITAGVPTTTNSAGPSVYPPNFGNLAVVTLTGSALAGGPQSSGGVGGGALTTPTTTIRPPSLGGGDIATPTPSVPSGGGGGAPAPPSIGGGDDFPVPTVPGGVPFPPVPTDNGAGGQQQPPTDAAATSTSTSNPGAPQATHNAVLAGAAIVMLGGAMLV